MHPAFRSLLACAVVMLPLIARAQERPRERYVCDWAGAAIAGEPLVEPPPGPGIELRRQDHGHLEINRSTVKTPLRIGRQSFEHGLGSHSIADILVRFPRPAKSLQSSIGIDSNGRNSSGLGSAVFSVQVGDRQAYRSPLCRGGEEPRVIDVQLNGAQAIRLRVFDGGDGSDHDHADWAEATVTYTDGSKARLDELPFPQRSPRFKAGVPFSFKLGGRSSAGMLRRWEKEVTELTAEPGKRRYTVTYLDPVTTLKIYCQLTQFTDVPAVEWVLSVENTGGNDSPVIEDLRPLDLSIDLPPASEPILYGANGSTASATDYLPSQTEVKPGLDLLFSPTGGRSSDGKLPFFNLAWPGGGMMMAVGWTGQWNLRIARPSDSSMRIWAGQELTHFVLHPHEKVRTPRILLVGWEGADRMRGHNLLRRTLVEHYMPRREGKPILPITSQNTWFVNDSGNGVNEKNQLEAIDRMAKCGVEAYWLDAGWFEGGWPSGVGSWVPRKEKFPNGLKPLGDAAHERGMKFILWFEPERVNPNSLIAREHPQWVLHAGKGDGLFNLANPEAREWMTRHLSKCITDWGVDIYRNDFNMQPLAYWRAADSPDRQGITECHYIEGLYAMWDELAKCRGGTILDDCASGGRRVDLEMISRALVLTRSDSVGANKPMPLWEQTQTMGLSLYYPGHATLGFAVDPYNWFSTATSGVSITQDTRTGFDVEMARKVISQTKELRELWTGDFYPLTPIDQDEYGWAAWQLDRPDLGKGCVLAFRRSQSTHAALDAKLQGLDAAATYKVSYPDTKQSHSLRGEELARLRIDVERAPGAAIVVYEKVK